jgi:hypothetical protein
MLWDRFLAGEVGIVVKIVYGDVEPKGESEKHPMALQETFDLGVRTVEKAWE